ncbi:MAG TPA: thioredoxin-disulfide reductase, partial [Thermoplasmatales archaeon]|nr:thioredoxin-disulfide reductase [Thermoplasmatales archaeon]
MKYDYEIAIVGAGAAGYAAAIYAGRSGARAAVFD